MKLYRRADDKNYTEEENPFSVVPSTIPSGSRKKRENTRRLPSMPHPNDPDLGWLMKRKHNDPTMVNTQIEESDVIEPEVKMYDVKPHVQLGYKDKLYAIRAKALDMVEAGDDLEKFKNSLRRVIMAEYTATAPDQLEKAVDDIINL